MSTNTRYVKCGERVHGVMCRGSLRPDALTAVNTTVAFVDSFDDFLGFPGRCLEATPGWNDPETMRAVTRGATCARVGPAVFVRTWKCSVCGHSVSTRGNLP